MKKFIQNGMFVLVIAMISNTVNASPFKSLDNIEIVQEWTEFKTVDGIKIEYKYQSFDQGTFRNQMLVLFRFTNTTSETKSMSWVVKEFRNDECYNCHRLDNPEYSKTITLTAGQSIEGDGSDVTNTKSYLFSHFIKLVPGMSGRKLTNFEFINVNVSSVIK